MISKYFLTKYQKFTLIDDFLKVIAIFVAYKVIEEISKAEIITIELQRFIIKSYSKHILCVFSLAFQMQNIFDLNKNY